jgi:beta-galactosidase
MAHSIPYKKGKTGGITCFVFFIFLFFFTGNGITQRQTISLNEDWYSIASATDTVLPHSLVSSPLNEKWKRVSIPHNWDSYEGYRRLVHGNRHGDSWYRKTFSLKQSKQQKRFFLFFEGVGSFAEIYLNGIKVGEHAGGRTSFTIDITNAIKIDGTTNQLSVRAWHPAGINNLPWVCGGCSDERGFSEGSQPMGIFRPVQLYITRELRIEPFGIHVWADLQKDSARLFINSTLRNYQLQQQKFILHQQLLDHTGKRVGEISSEHHTGPGDSITVSTKNIKVFKPRLWSPDDPYLYRLVTTIKQHNQVIDRVETSFGFRTISWQNLGNRFFINGNPVFINGVAEYEHLLGQSHAFSKEQVASRMKWLKMAGFNAFRDGHQPHNLLYGQRCNEMGILWWTQLSAHIWFDSPGFRKNFKQLLKEWVIERRNDPAVILWGLQNESKLPEDFAKECTELIRQLDPTASSQRLVTTCNGGRGTDWDVPQNWTGTYGGDPATYAEDLKKQILVGEYGAWRTLDLHTEGPFQQNGIVSEDRMTQLMEQKIRLAESVRDSSAGHFFWLLTSHDNPGRVQGGEGLRELDRIGPVNYKGLLTPWEEPLDVFYMYRSNYVSASTQPMVYIVSHTWPNRWMKTGIKDSFIVYSNCEEVELFNDVGAVSLGKKRRKAVGTHFQWGPVNIKYNVLYAVGYSNGKAVARDTIVLHHLPASPNFNKLYSGSTSINKPRAGYHYIQRINCGGPDYKDEFGNLWQADQALDETGSGWGSRNWTAAFPGMPAFFASQRRTFSPIKGTRDWKLFQSFRYGKDKLQYEFTIPDGEYLVELYFIEPWLGIGGCMDCRGMRLFDVAFNGKTVLKGLDIWKEKGSNSVLKKTIPARVKGNRLVISFPRTTAGQAIISAIAIATLKPGVKTGSDPAQYFTNLSCKDCREENWLDIGDKPFRNSPATLNDLPPNLYGANWLSFLNNSNPGAISFTIAKESDLFIGIDSNLTIPAWLKEYERTGTKLVTDEKGGKQYAVYRKRVPPNTFMELIADQPLMIVLNEASTLQPAYDLKPISPYRINTAQLSEGAEKQHFGGREVAMVKSTAPVSVQWPVTTGVADYYSLTVKYFWPADSILNGRVQLIGAGGSMMLDEKVQFSFTREGKWNQFTLHTPTMINAGNYTVKLLMENAKGLAVSGIDIQ